MAKSWRETFPVPFSHLRSTMPLPETNGPASPVAQSSQHSLVDEAHKAKDAQLTEGIAAVAVVEAPVTADEVPAGDTQKLDTQTEAKADEAPAKTDAEATSKLEEQATEKQPEAASAASEESAPAQAVAEPVAETAASDDGAGAKHAADDNEDPEAKRAATAE